jgi:hypothetical protein
LFLFRCRKSWISGEFPWGTQCADRLQYPTTTNEIRSLELQLHATNLGKPFAPEGRHHHQSSLFTCDVTRRGIETAGKNRWNKSVCRGFWGRPTKEQLTALPNKFLIYQSGQPISFRTTYPNPQLSAHARALAPLLGPQISSPNVDLARLFFSAQIRLTSSCNSELYPTPSRHTQA